MKIILDRVKIKYYNPSKGRESVYNGQTTVNYDVAIFVRPEHKTLIDTYLFKKCEPTKDGELLFYGRSKQPIPIFDQGRKKIEGVMTCPFWADVSVLIDDFKKENSDPIRYSKCLGIKFLEYTGEPSVIQQTEKFETYDEIFGTEANEIASEPPQNFAGLVTKIEMQQPAFYQSTQPEGNDLPF